jgi:16S rRNA (uracil1498-N3)-methyltransferase
MGAVHIAAAMTVPRFYYPVEMSPGQIVDLPAAIAHHAVRVLRLKQKDELVLFNGSGGEFRAVITRINKNDADVLIQTHVDVERESRLVITLAQALCASEKMDWIVQKAVELGVTTIQPLVTKQSVVRLSGERGERRVHHLEKVVISACEQCGRNHVPQVLPLKPLQDWLSAEIIRCKSPAGADPSNRCFILSLRGKNRLGQFGRSPEISAITLLVGPEGGFTQDEEHAAVAAGFSPLRLGERVLRTESAALAAVAAMQALWGDYY